MVISGLDPREAPSITLLFRRGDDDMIPQKDDVPANLYIRIVADITS
jgi:hypothetical protein